MPPDSLPSKSKRGKKPMRKHWYRIYMAQCPVCGSHRETRERVYGKPPTDPAKRYVWEPDSVGYDGCLY